MERNLHGKNLISIEKVLDSMQHVNIILVDVPFRYDLRDKP